MTSRRPSSVPEVPTSPQADAPAPESPVVDDPAPRERRPAPLGAGAADPLVGRVVAGFDGAFESLGHQILDEMEAGRLDAAHREALRARLADYRATLLDMEEMLEVAPESSER